MATPQIGIFALGTASHTYLELKRTPACTPEQLVRAVVNLPVPHSTVGSVGFVSGFHPEIWRALAPNDIPPDLDGFEQPLIGPDGYTMPATQSDVWLWFAGSSYGWVFDAAKGALEALQPYATLERELTGWGYQHSRDLTGFEDGTKNPNVLLAPSIATIPAGKPGAGGSVLLFQKWRHDIGKWEALPQDTQEKAIGRTKLDSIEFPEKTMPPDSHVQRTTVEEDGTERDIFRRNVAYGDVTEHGTVFVGFGADRDRLQRMLEQMAGVGDGIRDALTRYTTPLTGAYYFCPPIESLVRFLTPKDDD